MDRSKASLVTPLSLSVDLVLLAGFFVFMAGVLRSHVPSHDPRMITLWAAVTAGCLSAVFFLALQMFRVVFRAQRAAAVDNK